MNHKSTIQLENGLDHILASPADHGVLELIVRRPEAGQREVLDSGELDETEGLVGDNWIMRGSHLTADGSAHPDMQLNLINTRVIGLIAGSRKRWALAGDQLFVDMSLDSANLPAGTRLSIGEAEIEVTAKPHLGCNKFADRYGLSALHFVNDERGRRHNFRGINARVIRGGGITTGDRVSKI